MAEQGCLLSSYTPKGCRGFESPPLRQSFLGPVQCVTYVSGRSDFCYLQYVTTS